MVILASNLLSAYQPAGAQGIQGRQGITGQQGVQGVQGTQGTTGSGSQGTQGEQGIQGTQGIQGRQGITGSQGTQGTTGSGSQGTQGIQGIQGRQGITGPTTYPGAGIAVSTGSAWTTSKTSPTGDIVGTSDTQTMSNKGFTTVVDFAAGLDIDVVASPGTPTANTVRMFGRNAGGRILPAIIGPAGLDTSLQPLLARNKVTWVNARGNSTSVDYLGMDPFTITGTATAANIATTNVHTSMKRVESLVTGASSSAVVGFYSTATQYYRGGSGLGGFFVVFRFGPATGSAANSTRRMFCGLGSITGAPSDNNPSSNIDNALGVCCDSGDTNWQFVHRNGTNTATKSNMGGTYPKAATDRTLMYELVMFCAPGGTSVTMQFTNLGTNDTISYTASSTLPGTTTLLAPRLTASVGGTSSVVGMALSSMYIETDY